MTLGAANLGRYRRHLCQHAEAGGKHIVSDLKAPGIPARRQRHRLNADGERGINRSAVLQTRRSANLDGCLKLDSLIEAAIWAWQHDLAAVFILKSDLKMKLLVRPVPWHLDQADDGLRAVGVPVMDHPAPSI